MNERPIDILLVEDNPLEVELTVRAFRKLDPSKQIEVARDGAEALILLGLEPGESGEERVVAPHLILMDLKLPKLDGLALLVPVVMLTTSCESKDVVAAYQLGANSFLIKPIEFGKFQEAVEILARYWFELAQTAPPLLSK
jgi:two-component system response regulator